jgi:hypothetical protein
MADFELPVCGIPRRLCKLCGKASDEEICRVCKTGIHKKHVGSDPNDLPKGVNPKNRRR